MFRGRKSKTGVKIDDAMKVGLLSGGGGGGRVSTYVRASVCHVWVFKY